MRAQVGNFTLSGDGLAWGATAETPSARSTNRRGPFKGGTIIGVGVTVEKAQYLDLEKMAAAAFAVD